MTPQERAKIQSSITTLQSMLAPTVGSVLLADFPELVADMEQDVADCEADSLVGRACIALGKNALVLIQTTADDGGAFEQDNTATIIGAVIAQMNVWYFG